MHYGGFMRWVDLAVKPYFSWPNTQVEFQHEGKRLVLQPRAEELAYTASIYSDAGLTFDEGGSSICRFLSCLSWSKGSGVSELFIAGRSEEHTSELQSLMRNSYAVICLKKETIQICIKPEKQAKNKQANK